LRFWGVEFAILCNFLRMTITFGEDEEVYFAESISRISVFRRVYFKNFAESISIVMYNQQFCKGKLQGVSVHVVLAASKKKFLATK
jgi:hypothetical protein